MSKQLKERVQVGTDEAGKPIYKWATGYDKQSLFLSIAGILAVEAPKEETKVPLFCDYLLEFVETFKSKQEQLTMRTRAQCIKKHILPRFGGMPIDEITTAEIQKWFDELCDAGYARETILKLKHIISPVFDSAVEDEFIKRNPLKSPRLVIHTQRGKHHKAIPFEKMKEVREIIPSLPQRERRFAALLVYTGLRLEEVLGLRWEDIDVEARKIRIVRAAIHPTRNLPAIKEPKTISSRRIIPLAEPLINLLHPLGGDGFILGGEKPLTFQQQKRSFMKLRSSLGLEDYSAHDFRDTCATEWLEQGMTLQEVSKLLGHADTKVTEKCYIKFREEGMNHARMIMNGLYGPM